MEYKNSVLYVVEYLNDHNISLDGSPASLPNLEDFDLSITGMGYEIRWRRSCCIMFFEDHLESSIIQDIKFSMSWDWR